MSQQGEKPAANEDDWWRRLYDENARDTGTSDAADSLDDRFDSASDAVSPGAVSPVGGGVEGGGGAGGGASGEGFDGGPDGGYVGGYVGGADGGFGSGSVGGAGGGAGTPSEVMPEVDPVVVSRPVREETLRERAPWEPPAATVGGPGVATAGPTRPRTFAAPPIPVEPPLPSLPPSLPRQPVPETEPVQAVERPPAAPPPPSVPPLPKRPVAQKPSAPPPPAAAPITPDASVISIASVTPAQEAERESGPAVRPVIGHVGDRPPTYDPEPTALPAAVPQELDGLVADTVLDGARYGTYTLRAASVRGDSARFRGEPRRDALLTARFGTDERALVLVAVATGARAADSAHLAAADACRWIGAAVGRSHARLSEDIRAGRRGDLKSGLNRLTDRTYGKLRARAAELGVEPQQYTAGLRCLLLPADPDCRTRVFFGVGAGGLFRLRDGVWHDLEPEIPAVGDAGKAESSPEPPEPADPADPPAEPFRFRGSVARTGDALLLCGPGLAEPMRGEPALAEELAARWTTEEAPGLVAFLADIQLRVKGYSDDRTGVGVWEA
ncbi:protein phosphatase 2C domain-containing protein [Streptomyces sp. ADI95-17]|uniref:protein phosphatase 2C domain-containing protein n=1 Tax=Streptomyces sp. ADI95-17 TaxID=1522759 RepID=UPI000F5C1BAC|nr:protein phosphatase 2C domain-containing protein [Streptomyces sp. ADI95-17]